MQSRKQIDQTREATYPASMEVWDAMITVTGLVRDHNEDAIGHSQEIGLYVLADGMGGSKAGEIASQTLVINILDNIETAFKNNPTVSPSDFLIKAIQKANSTIFQLSQQDKAKEGMGTTATLLWIRSNRSYIAHVGDSRAYRFRAGKLQQLTIDHTRVNEMVKQGILTEEQARTHPGKNVITRAVGTQSEVKVDIVESEIFDGDIFMLCSDGLSNKVDPDILEFILGGERSEQGKCESLVQMANENGGEDNISVILVRCGSDATASTGKEQNEPRPSIDNIKTVPIFHEIPDNVVSRISSVAEIRTYGPNETVFSEGDHGDGLYVVFEGSVRIIKIIDKEKGLKKELAQLYPGDFFGEMSLIDQKPRSATVSTITESKLFRLSAEAFHHLLRENTEIAVTVLMGIMKTMSKRLRLIDDEIIQVFKERGKSAREVQELQDVLSIVFCRMVSEKEDMS